MGGNGGKWGERVERRGVGACCYVMLDTYDERRRKGCPLRPLGCTAALDGAGAWWGPGARSMEHYLETDAGACCAHQEALSPRRSEMGRACSHLSHMSWQCDATCISCNTISSQAATATPDRGTHPVGGGSGTGQCAIPAATSPPPCATAPAALLDVARGPAPQRGVCALQLVVRGCE